MSIIESKPSEFFIENLKELLGYQEFFFLRKATPLGKTGKSVRVVITHLAKENIISHESKLIKEARKIKNKLIENIAFIFNFDYSVIEYLTPTRISSVIFFKKLEIKQEKDSELYSKFKETTEKIFKRDSESKIIQYKKIFNTIHIVFEKCPVHCSFYPIHELKRLFFFNSSKLSEIKSEKGLIHVYRIELLRKYYSFVEFGICKRSVHLLIKYIKMLDLASKYIKREHRWFHIYLEFGTIKSRGISHFFQQVREKVEPCTYLFLGRDKTELSEGDLWIPSREELKFILHLNNDFDNSAFSDYHQWYQKNRVSIKCMELNLFAYYMKIKHKLFWDKNQNKWKHTPQKVFKINDYLTLKLEENQTNIYVKGKLFNHCKYLLFSFSKNELSEYEKIDSIDEIKDKYNKSHENDKSKISPEIEFWGHCSNLQAWYEHNYDTRILHSNLAFPLLKELSKNGDPLALKVFKDEIALRFESNCESVIRFLLNEKYLKFLNLNEINTLSENLDLMKWTEHCFDNFSEQWISKASKTQNEKENQIRLRIHDIVLKRKGLDKEIEKSLQIEGWI